MDHLRLPVQNQWLHLPPQRSGVKSAPGDALRACGLALRREKKGKSLSRLLFGVSGLPLDDGRKYTYATAIAALKRLGLDVMELPFVRSVNVTPKNAPGILRSKRENAFTLSAHGSYYLNLNAATRDKQDASLARITKAAEALALVGGRDLVFHPGYYGDSTPEAAYATIRDNLRRLPRTGIRYCLETTGKSSQFGALDELIRLCQEVDTCALCLDFAHIHARTNGGLPTVHDFAAVLRAVADGLGRDALSDLHIHLSGIAYGPKGERRHLPFAASDFDAKACLAALCEVEAGGCVICESPLVELDALWLQTCYQRLCAG